MRDFCLGSSNTVAKENNGSTGVEDGRGYYSSGKRLLLHCSNTIFGPQYPLGDSCTVFRPEHGSASRVALLPSVFEKIAFDKNCKFSNQNIFCAETK